MSKVKMTLTRALAEIKLLDSKILSFQSQAKEWVAVSKNGVIKGYQDVAAFKSNIQSNKDKLGDLIDRRNEIKRALIVANNTVSFELGGTTFTIAEAIDRKNFISTEKTSFNFINMSIVKAKALLDQEERTLDKKVEETVNRSFEGDGKKDADLIKSIEKNIRESNKFILEDSCGIEKWVTFKLEEIQEFENEIDFKLSEINSQNYINI